MKQTFLFICWLSFFYSFGQNFQIIDTSDYKLRQRLIKSFEANYELFNQNIKQSYKGATKKELLKIYEQSQSKVIELIENKKLLFEASFQNYADTLYAELKASNPILQKEQIKLFISKNTSPNAISIGDGTIFLNIGLFSFLENKYQLQSVIAHEVGHQLLQHTKNNIEKRARINTQVLSNKSIASRSIQTKKYNKSAQSFNLLKDLLYEEGELRRQQEIEADSLGFMLYKNTHHSKTEYVNTLVTLKTYDSVPSIEIDSTVYFKIFNLPNQNFKNSWLENEDFKNYNYEFYKSKIDLDSLREHPDLTFRIDKLYASFSEIKNENLEPHKTDETFKNLQQTARKAYVENLYFLNEYGLSTYLILKRLENNYDDVYYKKWLGINFESIYEAKKKYQLNRYVDRLIPNEQSKSYQTFLNFIWNLSLNDIKTIADYYNQL
ncbi:M48 family metalloprotease [Yeosuana sp. AK3]